MGLECLAIVRFDELREGSYELSIVGQSYDLCLRLLITHDVIVSGHGMVWIMEQALFGAITALAEGPAWDCFMRRSERANRRGRYSSEHQVIYL